MKYSRIIAAVQATPWAILPQKLHTILAFLRFKADDGEVSAEEIAMIKQPQREPVYYACDFDEDEPVATSMTAGPSSTMRGKGGQIAVLPISGTISHRMGGMSEFSGGTSTERFSQWLQAALNDPTVKSIVLDVNSPGGTVDGVPELADEIYKANQTKPVVAVANAQAASAAYWLASQAGELVVTPSGQVGSIGVFGAHQDVSEALAKEGVKTTLISAGKYKTEGNPFEPLSADAKQALQDSVNTYYDQFTAGVARGRQSNQQAVKDGFGQGRMVDAKAAVKQGMADRVATMDQTLARLKARTPSVAAPQAEAISATSEMEIVPLVTAEVTSITFTGTSTSTSNPVAPVVEPAAVEPAAAPEPATKSSDELLAAIHILEEEIELDSL